MIRSTLALAAAAILMSSPAYADIVSGKLTGGSALKAKGKFRIIAPPPQVGKDDFNDPYVRAFDEAQDYTLTKTLKVNVGTNIAAGTTIDSYYVNFDPKKSMTAIGDIVFSTPILGIIFSKSLLDKSDYLGVPTTSYKDPKLRGIECGDRVSFLGNTLSFDLHASSPGDSFRVITAAVPEPATWGMMILGFGMMGAGLRYRRRPLAVAHA